MVIAAVLAGCGDSTDSPPTAAPTALAVPLDTSFSVAGASYAVVAMGDLGQPANTFWQLVVRPARSSDWSLVTPPGVATNGGLVLDHAGGSHLTAGFLPAGDLRFSPLATTADGGRSWVAAGVAPSGFSPVPDALAGTAPKLLALVPTAGGEVVESSAPSYSDWTTVVGSHALGATAAGRRCDLEGLSALAVGAGGLPLVGASCGHGVAGVFVEQGATWQLAPVDLPAAIGTGPTSILRLTGAKSGDYPIAGLAATGGNSPALAAIWGGDSAAGWQASPALPLTPGASLVSSSFGVSGQCVVLWRDPSGGQHAAVDDGPGQSWVQLPAPPAGTSTIVLSPAGAVDALAVDTSILTDWRLVRPLGGWRKIQTMEVPIEYGSSS